MKIGMIDKYLNEWHADHLPDWLREEAGDVEEIYAWEMMPPPEEDRIPGPEWAKEHNVTYCETEEEVIEKSDVLIVLAPNYPEIHEELADKALRSGKPTYVDKTFAPDPAAARRLIEKAKAHGTPMFSSSALRFSEGLADFDKEGIVNLSMRGPGLLGMYCIHHIEPIIMLMGHEAEDVMFLGTEECPGYVIRFSDGRFATSHHLDFKRPFSIHVKYKDGKPAGYMDDCKDFYPGFVTALVKFFRTKEIPVDPEETVAVIAVREAIMKAKDMPGEWVKVVK